MQVNWSIILNVVLLAGVMVAIFRVLRTRKKLAYTQTHAPSLGAQPAVNVPQGDDIIAVRKLNVENQGIFSNFEKESLSAAPETVTATVEHTPISKGPAAETQFTRTAKINDVPDVDNSMAQDTPPIMMFLLAKSNRQLAGYELLQAVLAAGLRFGEGNLFHRHQYANGQGPILCSLAAATDEGVFDLQNIGAFTVRGLCLYMHPSGNAGIDAERFDIMLDTAKTLSEDLDAYLLDDRRKPLSDMSIQRYHQRLHLIEEAVS